MRSVAPMPVLTWQLQRRPANNKRRQIGERCRFMVFSLECSKVLKIMRNVSKSGCWTKKDEREVVSACVVSRKCSIFVRC